MDIAWSLADRRESYKHGLAIRAIAAVAFLVLFIAIELKEPGPQIPALPKLAGVLLLLILVNPLFWWIGAQRSYPLSDFRVHWAVDLSAVTAGVHFLGGLEVPLTPTAYMIMIVTSASFSTMRMAFQLAGWSALCLTAVLGAEEIGWLPREHVEFAAQFTQQGRIITVAGLIVLFFVFAYLAGMLAEQLRLKTSKISSQKAELEGSYTKEQAARQGIVLLSALVQHDVYSPLAVISGACAEAIRSCREGDLATCEKFVAMIEDRLLSIESAVETLGLFQVGQDQDEQRDYELRAVADEVIEHLMAECRERNVDVRIDGMWQGARVKRGHLYHVLRNLLTNAIKSVADDGTGVVIVRSAITETSGSAISVIDNGPGLSKDARERLFRLSTPTHALKPGGGFGAGLALSSNLVRNWGGDLRYEPRPEGGSVFTVVIPA